MSLLSYGINKNIGLFLHLIFQVLLVGLMFGTMRTLVPTLATTEFGLAKDSNFVFTTFIIVFGLAKATLNFLSGKLSVIIGRKNTFLCGWLVSIPIPFIIYYATSWWEIVFSTLLLGINQGFTWSMTQTSKLDIVHVKERGFAVGLNESIGYLGLAISSMLMPFLATIVNPRLCLFVFDSIIILVALVYCLLFIKDTLLWSDEALTLLSDRYVTNQDKQFKFLEIFKIMSWENKQLMSICQAGLVEKFADAIIWILYPIFYYTLALA